MEKPNRTGLCDVIQRKYEKKIIYALPPTLK